MRADEGRVRAYGVRHRIISKASTREKPCRLVTRLTLRLLTNDMSDSDSEDTLDLLEEAGQLGDDEKQDKAEGTEENDDGGVSDGDAPDGEEKPPTAKELRDQKVEDWLNRWTRAAGINEV